MTEFSLKHMGLANLNAGNGIDPFVLSAIGISVVFCGLLLIFIYITLLPKFLNGSSKKEEQRSQRTDVTTSDDGQDPDLLVAVAVAVHLEMNCQQENRAITWKRPARLGCSWQRSGRMWQMNDRLSHFPRSRKI